MNNRRAPAARLHEDLGPADALILDAACIFLATWTISCHVVVATGGSLTTAVILFSIAIIVAAVVTMILFRTRSGQPFHPSPLQVTDTPMAQESPYIMAGTLFVVCVSVGLAVAGDRPLLLWWSLAAVLVFGALRVAMTSRPIHSPARPHRPRVLGLMAIGLVCVGATAAMHRWDADDVFYISLAASAADHPGVAILTTDVMHGIPGLPLHLELYRVHSWEMLMGAVSLLTGIPAIACFHWIAASMAAFLMPLAWGRLFRILAPDRWLWATAVLLVVLFFVGDAPRWFGSFGPARIWQGKAVFVSVFLPLVTAFGLEFGEHPSLRRAVRLTAAVIACVGLTVNALWLAPAAAVIAAISAVPRWGRGTVALAAGAGAAAAYPVAIGLAFRPRIEETTAVIAGKTAISPTPDEWMSSLVSVFGSTELLAVALIAMGSVWILLPSDPARRFAAFASAAAWLTFLNPYAIDVITRFAVGPVYWRALWAVPFPALLTLLLISPALWDRLQNRAGLMLSTALVTTLAIVVPGSGQLSSPDISFHSPTLKVPPVEYGLAQRIAERVAPGEVVVAPREVGDLLPTMQSPPYPLEARRYLRSQTAHISEADLRLRRQMIIVAGGRNRRPGAIERFRMGLDRFRVALVCLQIVGEDSSLRETLSTSGFILDHTSDRHEIWIRDPGLTGRGAVKPDGDSG